MCKLKSWEVIKQQRRWGLQGQAGRQMKRQTHAQAHTLSLTHTPSQSPARGTGLVRLGGWVRGGREGRWMEEKVRMKPEKGPRERKAPQIIQLPDGIFF